MKLHKIIFYIFLFLLPVQLRIVYNPETSYIEWFFNYHLAIIVYFTDLLLFLCFTTWFITDFNQISKISKKIIISTVLVLFPFLFLGMFHVKHLDLSIYNWLKLVELSVLVLYIYSNYVNTTIYVISLVILFFSSLLQAIIGLLQFHMQHMVGLRFLGEYIASIGTPGVSNIVTASGRILRAYGTMPHPNVLGAFLIFGLVLGIYLLYVSRETKYKHWIGIGLIILSLGIFVTFSRIAWLVTAAVLILYVSYFLHLRQKILAITLIAICFVSCATIFSFYHNELNARVKNDDKSVSIQDRQYFNNLGWTLFKNNWILGVGVGNYIPALQSMVQLEPWQYQPPHNIFIFLGAELGLFGLGLFIWFLYMIIRRLKYILSEPLLLTIYCLLFTVLFMGQFDHYFVTIQQGRLMFAVVLGLTAALPNLNKKYDN